MEPKPLWDEVNIRRRLRAQGFAVEGALPPVTWFGDGPELADRLGELVRRGLKTATSSLLWEYEAEGSPVPHPGNREIVVSWGGEPLAVIEVTEVRVLPFEEVDADFARDEGEGDRSLGGWREGHRRFFSRVSAAIDRGFDPRMPVVCVRFRVLHTAPDRESR